MALQRLAVLLKGGGQAKADEVRIWFGLALDPGDGCQIVIFVGDVGVDKANTANNHEEKASGEEEICDACA